MKTAINEALLEKHLHNGRFHIRSIWDEEVKPTDTYDNPLALSMFFDGTDEEYIAVIEERSPTTAEAIRRNETAGKERKAEKEATAQDFLAKFHNGQRLTNAEANFLVETGHAHNVYDDPDSNRPTHFMVHSTGDGKAHADWETEEGLAQIGL